MKTAALIIANPEAGQLGHARRLGDELGDTTVLGMTVRRVAATPGLDRVLVLHPEGASLPESFAENLPIPVQAVAISGEGWDSTHQDQRRVRRAWTLDGWRGGFRGATAWDELLPAAPIAQVAREHGLDAVLLAGGDWPLVDPALNAELVSIHRSAPDNMKLCFSQAPPGLSGILIATPLLRDMADTGHDFSSLLAYNPRRPALDPISLEFNAAVPASVRDTARRLIYDTPEGRRRLRGVFDQLGPHAAQADAVEITDAVARDETAASMAGVPHVFAHLPPQVAVELTPRRVANGPITPGHHAPPERPDLSMDLLRLLAPQLHGRTVTLGGVGDARLYPDWKQAAALLRESGALCVALASDLLAGPDESADQVAQSVLTSELDALFVPLHAETAETYAQEMGVGGFAQVMQTLHAIFQRPRTERPAVVPTLTKTDTTTPEMETFFERWWQLADHAVIQRFPTGGKGGYALAPDRNPVPMDPPWREPDPLQRKHRLTVWSDGEASLCHQDWLGRATLGNVRDTPLLELWQRVLEMNLDPAWGPDESPMCRRCYDFARLHTQHTEPVPA